MGNESNRGFTTSILHSDRDAAIEHGALHKPLHLSVAYGYRDANELAAVFQKAGAKVVDMDDAAFQKWQAIAKDTAYKDFENNVKDGKRLLDMALSVK